MATKAGQIPLADEMVMNRGLYKPFPFVASRLFCFPDIPLRTDKVFCGESMILMELGMGSTIFLETPRFGSSRCNLISEEKLNLGEPW